MESKFKHIGSFLLLCFLFFLYIPIFINIDGRWYSVDSALDIAKAIAGYIVGATLLSTIIIAVILHRIHDTLRDINESIKGARESIKVNTEWVKANNETLEELESIEKKISERPPVIIQKKESNQ